MAQLFTDHGIKDNAGQHLLNLGLIFTKAKLNNSMNTAILLNSTERRRDIQALRGLAVLAVVLFHAEESLIPLGFLGVDIFFVISGFVITPLIIQIFTKQVLIGERLSNLKYFYKRRFYRLAPALGITLLISAVLTFFGTYL